MYALVTLNIKFTSCPKLQSLQVVKNKDNPIIWTLNQQFGFRIYSLNISTAFKYDYKSECPVQRYVIEEVFDANKSEPVKDFESFLYTGTNHSSKSPENIDFLLINKTSETIGFYWIKLKMVIMGAGNQLPSHSISTFAVGLMVKPEMNFPPNFSNEPLK